jgi:hypothetical protein
VDPAFEGFFAGLLKSKTDAAVAEARKLHHALRLIEISLGDPEVAQGIRINHSAKFLLEGTSKNQQDT